MMYRQHITIKIG